MLQIKTKTMKRAMTAVTASVKDYTFLCTREWSTQAHPPTMEESQQRVAHWDPIGEPLSRRGTKRRAMNIDASPVTHTQLTQILVHEICFFYIDD